MIPFLVRVAALALAAQLLAGCAQDSVIFATSTTLGIDIETSNQTTAEVTIGYDRAEGVTMPLIREERRWRIYKGFTWFCNVPILKGLLCTPIYRYREHEGFAVLAAAKVDTGAVLPTHLDGDATRIWQVFATGSVASSDKAMKAVAHAMRGQATFKQRREAALVGELASKLYSDHKAVVDGLLEKRLGASDKTLEGWESRVKEALEDGPGRKAIHRSAGDLLLLDKNIGLGAEVQAAFDKYNQGATQADARKHVAALVGKDHGDDAAKWKDAILKKSREYTTAATEALETARDNLKKLG